MPLHNVITPIDTAAVAHGRVPTQESGLEAFLAARTLGASRGEPALGRRRSDAGAAASTLARPRKRRASLVPAGEGWLAGASLAFLVLTYGILFALQQGDAVRLTSEDNVIENLGALFFFYASGWLVLAAIHERPSDGKAKARYRFLAVLLSCGLLWIALEEISYGQRIFDFSSPELFKAMNTQKEFNLHNLAFVSSETGLAHWWNVQRLFSLFWLGYCVMFPLAHARSGWLRRLTCRVYVPVASAWIGCGFVLNYVAAKGICLWLVRPELVGPATEIKETNYALLFACLAYVELRKQWEHGRVARGQPRGGRSVATDRPEGRPTSPTFSDKPSHPTWGP